MTAATYFYRELESGAFEPSDATTSPWDTKLQHGSPPTALLVWALERAHPQPHMRVTRISVDFLGGLPRERATVATRVVRPGRRVELSEATLSAGGREVAIARVWRVGTQAPGTVPERPARLEVPPRGASSADFGPKGWGYGCAFDWSFARGAVLSGSGPAQVWSRVRIPLVEGHALAPLDRLLLVVDSANGVSAELSFAEWLFVPPSLSIALQRYPEGEWTFMDARTTLSDDGAGVTNAVLADERGVIAFANQVLYVEPRNVSPKG